MKNWFIKFVYNKKQEMYRHIKAKLQNKPYNINSDFKRIRFKENITFKK